MIRYGDCRRARRALGLAVLAAIGFSLPSWATELDLQQLPLVEPFECLICHVSDPLPADLNSFGSDFLANGRIWNATLAAVDSDGDACVNGVELGDVGGDGNVDGNVTSLLSNPGVAGDCGGSNVDVRTWGELKALFELK
ncbi:MAG TPA: hypothetical protein PLL30_05225 [Candidatus Krumholzibacteria bacterium]|nr:hypothetical protein [Candidatus Krumholzibacteria bacterium]HPD71164.1 hypothetical protein [Candidatus Krumholzibacteria bacterium]HRY39136.1 hypothetical protein [Candidatus Krumholzibacteria bacterium]